MSTQLSNIQPAGDWWQWYPPTYPSLAVTNLVYTTIKADQRCAWCQGFHTDKCPRLKAVTYRKNGTVERVEFFDEEGDKQD